MVSNISRYRSRYGRDFRYWCSILTTFTL